MSWFKDGVPFGTSPGVIVTSAEITDGGFVFVKSTVEICNTNQFDAAVYRCSAANIQGSDSDLFTLTGERCSAKLRIQNLICATGHAIALQQQQQQKVLYVKSVLHNNSMQTVV